MSYPSHLMICEKKSCLMKKPIFAVALLLSFALILVSTSFAQSQPNTPQEILNQYISDLQKNPNDSALREKIIKFVQEMKPAPVIPGEAEKSADRAEYVVKSAKTEADFADAAKEYEKALLIAPWVSAYYFNLSLVYEAAGQPLKAAHSLQWYLLATPDAQDAREIRKKIAELEYVAEKATKEVALMTEGKHYFELGRYQEAAESFKQAISIKPDEAKSYFCLAMAYEKLNRHQEAVESCKLAISIKPADPKAHYVLALTYFALKDLVSFKKEYEIVKNLDEKMAVPLFPLIESLQRF